MFHSVNTLPKWARELIIAQQEELYILRDKLKERRVVNIGGSKYILPEDI